MLQSQTKAPKWTEKKHMWDVGFKSGYQSIPFNSTFWIIEWWESKCFFSDLYSTVSKAATDQQPRPGQRPCCEPLIESHWSEFYRHKNTRNRWEIQWEIISLNVACLFSMLLLLVALDKVYHDIPASLDLKKPSGYDPYCYLWSCQRLPIPQ